MICNIGELAGLFERSASLEDFLQTVVSVVAYHMRAAVCSVYLYDEDGQELVLRATQGLNKESVGKVRLKLGEGLSGIALKELRPIREGSAFHNPNFKFFPGIEEEKYQAFLAVPIVRGLVRVGVMVLQDPVQDYFDENDTKALIAIAAQLASTIENAKLLMALHRIRTDLAAEAKGPPAEPLPKFIKGRPGARGHGRGRAVVIGAEAEGFVDEGSLTLPGGTLEDFLYALKQTEIQLEALQVQMDRRLADVASMIFSAHILILKDRKFSGAMGDLIRGGLSAREAIVRVVSEYVRLFAKSPNPRLQEKVQDVKDLGRRLIGNLVRDNEESPDYTDHVIVARELLPSDILKLSAQNAEGLVLVGGGETAHVTILARSLDLPMVMVNEPRLLEEGGELRLLVDGDQGNLYLNPDGEILAQFDQLDATRREAEGYGERMGPETRTRDGTRVRLMANINMLSELEAAKQLKAEGVGLYRSEFPFIVRTSFPSEEEQYRVYRRLVEEMAGHEITFRTLDVGGDKILSYGPGSAEANPFLGLRAIRFSFRYRDVFEQQLRAMLRAGVDAKVRIMFPLISSVEDFVEARKVVGECIAQLAREGVAHHGSPKLGVMIEVPAAVGVVEELAREADFLSIGGNDLVQYILAVDRTNEQLSDFYVSHHPAVLRALERIAVAARKHKRPLSFCGEMAADPRMLPFLVGIGIHAFSVEPRRIPSVHQVVTKLSYGVCGKGAKKVLKLGRLAEIDAAIRAMAP
ncbi:MAG TPA: phosphoenolpyruvate--protein phosphotransferase [Kiritimatiellia bacterium]|nr:phosphoenolpyruvate--protein phosphotransferase [Kiritimatiellia bacterium]